MLRVGIFTTRSSRYHPNMRLLEASRALGQDPFLLHPLSILAEASPAAGDETGSVGSPHVLITRIGSTIEDAELAVLYHLERMGVPVVNPFDAIAVARDKFLSIQKLAAEGLPVPQTILLGEPGQLASAVDRLGGFPLILKPVRGRQGTGVFLVREMSFARYILEHPPRPEGMIVQRYLASATPGDYRIVVVGGKAVASMKRIPRQGEFRANIHLRGVGRPWNPPLQWRRLALEAAEALGLHVAGVDLIEGPDGPVVLEVNTTPGFRELERVTGVDVARAIAIQAAAVAEGRRRT